jgi:heme exporter protein A
LTSVASSRIAAAGSTSVRASPDGPAIRLEAVTRVFGVNPALVRADLHLARGEALLVRGPNGAGKTTLLRVIATALSPTYGRGAVLGFDLVAGREEIRRRTELVGHRARLYEELTPVENLRFTCVLYGLDPRRAADALERVGLAGVGDQRAGTLSQGMRQRVALARAVLRRPDLLLLDDPLAGLDTAGRAILVDEIATARSEGRTAILTTHEPGAEALATRVVHMERGRLLP